MSVLSDGAAFARMTQKSTGRGPVMHCPEYCQSKLQFFGTKEISLLVEIWRTKELMVTRHWG